MAPSLTSVAPAPPCRFAWANSLFASLVLKVADERPQIIFSS